MTDGATPGLVLACCDLAPGVRVAHTGRLGGVSRPPHDPLNLAYSTGDDPAAVTRNRRLVADACGLAPEQFAWLRQVHGARVRYARAGDVGTAADAMFADAAGVVLGILVADCAAVLLADPSAGVVGAAHAGRRGTAAGVVPALVRAMTSRGARPDRMRAFVGPAICGGCYEVSAALQARVAVRVPRARCTTRSGAPGLDIRAAVAGQLADLGVRHVRHDDRCTAETDDLCSHRRDGGAGRCAALVWRER